MTSFSASVLELYGILWNFIIGLMERNNYGVAPPRVQQLGDDDGPEVCL